MAMGTRSLKLSFQKIAFKDQPEIFSYRLCWKKEEQMLDSFLFSFNGCRRLTEFFLCPNCQHADKNSSCDDIPTTSS